MTPEAKARLNIDALLQQAGWHVRAVAQANIRPPLTKRTRIVAEVDRHLSILREVETEVDANLQCAQALRQAMLARAIQPAH